MINASLSALLATVSIGGGALVDVVNLHYLVKYNNNINPLDSH